MEKAGADHTREIQVVVKSLLPTIKPLLIGYNTVITTLFRRYKHTVNAHYADAINTL